MRRTLAILAALIAVGSHPAPLQPQLSKKIKAAVKQKAEQRKAGTEDHIADETAKVTDTAIARVTTVVDSGASKLSTKAANALGKVGAKGASEPREVSAMRRQLKEGRADLTGFAFPIGGDALPVESQGPLEVLAQALAKDKSQVLIQGRADGKTSKGRVAGLATRRAQSVKQWLTAWGIDPARLLVAADGVVAPGGAFITILRVE